MHQRPDHDPERDEHAQPSPELPPRAGRPPRRSSATSGRTPGTPASSPVSDRRASGGRPSRRPRRPGTGGPRRRASPDSAGAARSARSAPWRGRRARRTERRRTASSRRGAAEALPAGASADAGRAGAPGMGEGSARVSSARAELARKDRLPVEHGLDRQREVGRAREAILRLLLERAGEHLAEERRELEARHALRERDGLRVHVELDVVDALFASNGSFPVRTS